MTFDPPPNIVDSPASAPASQPAPQLQMVWPVQRLHAPPFAPVPPGYRLRTYRPGDEPGFYHLMERAGWPGWNEFNLQPWLARIPPESWFMLIHETSNQIVASAMGLHDHSSLHPFGGEMGWVAADPAHASKGLGAAVCAAVTARLLRAGYRDIHLYTEDWRLPALKTYLKLGYIPFLFTDGMQERWQAICSRLQWPFTPASWQQPAPAPAVEDGYILALTDQPTPSDVRFLGEQFDLIIKNGVIVTTSYTARADVGIRAGRIAAIGENLSGARAIDAAGRYVIPGGVDIHVHMQMALGPDVISSDTFFTGTRAAALGGTTTLIDFVETKRDETMLEALAARRAEADPQVVIDYGLHMTIGPNDIAKLDQIPGAFAAGCASFKLYMAYGLRLTDDQLLLALEAVRDVDGRPVIHAENWDVICALIARNLAAGRTTPHWHPRSRPALLEGEAAGRAIDIAEFVGIPLHIFHVSCADVVARIRTARARGLLITGETCPQYLFLTQDAYDAPGLEGTLPVCSPPLRPLSDQEALWRALAAGDLQLVTTDHCPFDRATKGRGLSDFSKIPGGVPSIEMRLAGLYQGVRRGHFSLNRWVDLCCTAPARLMGLSQKGDIAPGLDADLVIFDPDRAVTLSTDFLHENVDWTPYAGLELVGWPEMVLSRGEVIVEQGEFKGMAGRGKFIAR